ncbi:phosphatidylserine/phosphatidylglycerophosphate/cardiolipin synthase family protein [Dactylosporangium sp. NPDC051541]|uniref:phosphatidylserine/phosphatidylglycerophosphate/ cardiolipin synthase family protein n=1 Tax=Dactylosporangium sp. NPDC051541 TaxID=3363977 RepID=UPI0037A65098
MTQGESRRDYEPAQSPRVVRKLAASVAIGVFVYLVTNVWITHIDETQIWVITLSLLIGAVVFLTQFLHDMDSRMGSVERAEAKHAQVIESLVDDRLTRISDEVTRGFTKINEATELFGLVEASALRTDAMTQLVRHATQIPSDAPALVHSFAQAEIGRTSEFLKELSEGSNVIYEGEDRDWMLALARNTRHSIDATSLTTVDARGTGFVDGGLWSSDLGQRYLEVQRDAIQRKVRVRRVFIMDRATLAGDPMFLEVCKLQTDLGIEVRVLDTSAIPGTRRSSLFDFILFDDTVSYETTPASSIDGSVRPAIVNTRLELRASRVRDRIDRFQDLWTHARNVDG